MELESSRFDLRALLRRRGGAAACFALTLAAAISAPGQSADEDPLPPLPPLEPNPPPPHDWSAWEGVQKLFGFSQASITSTFSYTSDTTRKQQAGEQHTTVFMELVRLGLEEFPNPNAVGWRVTSANGIGTLMSSYSNYALSGGLWLGGEGTVQGSYSGPLSLRLEPTLYLSLQDGSGDFLTLREPPAPWPASFTGSVTERSSSGNGVTIRNFAEIEMQDPARSPLEHSGVGFTATRSASSIAGRMAVTGPSGDGSGLGSGSFHRTASVHFWPDWNDVEVRVEIEDSTRPGAPYSDWRPEGNLENPDAGGPRPLRLKATLRPKAEFPTLEQLKAMPSVRRFRFELAETSREPGVCMNWPAPSGDTFPKEDPEYDLRFIATVPAAMQLSPRKSKAGVQPLPGEDPNLPSAWVLLECFDFGAHANLQVYADLADGRSVVGHMKVGEEKRHLIPIPERVAGTIIAQKWREDHQARGADGDDQDDQPTGDGQDGDGFSVYEEYRGFRVNGEHVSLDPAVKDLFVRNFNGGPVAAACRALEVRTAEGGRQGLKIHEKLVASEWHGSRVMNYNRSANSPRSTEEPQHCLLLIPGSAAGDVIISYADIVRHPRRPKNTERILIHPLDNTVETIVHEMAHAIGVQHHGGSDYWAQWIVLELKGPDGFVRRRFFEQAMESNGETGTLSPSGTPLFIRIFKEGGGAEILPDQSTQVPLPDPVTLFIGKQGGLHSGEESCFMRYNCAKAYVPKLRPLDRILAPRNVVVDPAGTAYYTFCKTCRGTGMNPQRFGHADRGDCLEQLCVRDSAPERTALTGQCTALP